ncbi:MAG TPA: LysR family transcriptional regulator [Rhodoblastus sp.]|nr:LysR family transcriptional regulator [Rhodoblastus sp.]
MAEGDRSDIPNLRHLRAVCMVAETRSVSRAAERIHLSQPAITQAIDKLEARLGAALFEHGPEGMASTQAGRLFCARAATALEFLRAGARDISRAAGRARAAPELDRLITVAQLRALIAVSTAGNFSLAARNIGLSQPSVHRAAKELERLAGISLFEAATHGIELTRPAQYLAQQARLAFVEIEHGFAEVAELSGGDSSRLVVGAMPLARSHILPEAIDRLMKERPNLHVRVVDGPYRDLLHGLRNGGIDVLIGALRDPAPIDDIEQIPLFDDRLVIVARVGHPLFAREKIDEADLMAYPWVVSPPGAPTRDYFETMFPPAARENLPGLIETSSLIMVRGALLRSDRLTLISAHQIVTEQTLGLLAPLPVPTPGSARRIGLTIRRGWRPTAAHELLMSHIRAACVELEPTLSAPPATPTKRSPIAPASRS